MVLTSIVAMLHPFQFRKPQKQKNNHTAYSFRVTNMDDVEDQLFVDKYGHPTGHFHFHDLPRLFQ